MRAIDTTIIARYVVRDDAAQAKLATEILSEPCVVSDTVLLEAAWLLSSRYRLSRSDLAATFRDLLSLPTIYCGDAERIGWAVDRFTAGADFADMMHLVSARGADGFVTFDRRLARAAGPHAPVPVETLR